MKNAIGKVKAGPTKEFFVSMITRDILLPHAIVELIDNSIDGIKRQKAEEYDKFFIKITFNKNSFEIEDNCGGIDLSIAKNYAFVFGKPQTARDKEERVETTGTFGIGMKRALFKMGNNFEVISKAKNSSFTLRINVNEWMKEDEWDFLLDEANDSEKNKVSTCGTKITVTNLFPGISKDFDYSVFVNEVINRVRERRNGELAKGLNIIINGIKIKGSFLSIINGGDVVPYKYKFESNHIKVMILAGISHERDPDKAGWYIYCNNREVLAADKSSLTTWKDDKDTEGLPFKYHNNFAYFRGFVFFTSTYPERLPWNTSKTSIDNSSEIYQEARPHMIDAFKIFSSELKKLAGLDEEIRKEVTQELKKNAKTEMHYYTALDIKLKTSIAFVGKYEEKVREVAVPMAQIRFQFEKEKANKVKKALNVNTYHDAGKKTFEYFIDMEEI